MKKINKTAAVSGLRLRLDVPTKCQIVGEVLSTSFKTKKEQNAFITRLADQNFVNPVTVKLWVGKYQNIWKAGSELPSGTMSFSFATVPDNKIAATNSQLKNLRDALSKLANTSQTQYYNNLKASDVQSNKTPGEILDELVTNKKAK